MSQPSNCLPVCAGASATLPRVRSGDELILAALAAGLSQPAAARHAGVSERTVRRRLEDPSFAASVEQARGALVERTSAQLLGAAEHAVAALRDLLDTGPPAVRVRAALGLLAAAAWRESADTERRLAALEAAAEQQPASRVGAHR